MLDITIAAVGKLSEQYWRDAVNEYSKRLSRYCRLTVVEAEDEGTPDGKKSISPDVVMEREGERLLRALKPGTYVIALAIRGKRLSSEAFAEKIDQLAVSGRSSITFVIGGSLGLSPRVLERADYQLSFSDMTFPHQLMRVILLEQIYRAFRINRGEPYHK